MDCSECKSLEETLEASLSNYKEARSAAYYRVSTERAAKKNVDMERARNDLEEHPVSMRIRQGTKDNRRCVLVD